MAKKYIATAPLFIGYARAHNIGDEVPADNVERNGWSDMVATEGTKAAESAVKAAAGDGEPLSVSDQGPAPK